MTRRVALSLVLVITLSVACGEPDSSSSPAGTTAAPGSGEDALYEGYGLVLESEGRGPELCLGAATDSAPPQCRGIPLEGWSWDDVPGETSSGGGTWGEYRVVGAYDGESFTVTEASVPEEFEPVEEEDRYATPCPTPEGGWVAPHPERATHEHMGRAQQAAGNEPDYVAGWVDLKRQTLGDNERGVPDYTKVVLNYAFTGDVERHERELREIWGGPLCVFERDRQSFRELKSIQRELGEVAARDFGLQVLWSDIDEVEGTVGLAVVVLDEETRAAMAERYGEGVVDVHARLQPVD